ncbi:putative DNA-binding transcriptional regulator [Mycolicibacterium phlei]|uniref:TetR/AcrR family transcriptional regulator n=1 Tax=Mycobacteroides chelonae TaxID=1774 RepID=UPI000618CF04|nr:TetR family transcriptional regulator C-terminal domain-containing protein [Mycobacteroides chelonae]VEG18695.1 putative DNA-binding transcriptional regulator [Mycolicibacterium phlei]AKC39805.1 TetR family transcriptional regulator [Mycobacteroides chelonae]ANA99356.1 TetR family transcriptional regulator [Mycobacteroides chelonae CCUG 47445]OLT70784.1 TetR family transcriptional regulator [Mycobacteroides chelonae]ORV11184.1 TetR family transcriptional regulator [Mycobacteroides chelonae]
MTNLVDRPNSERGGRRRAQLVQAGVELLCEGGWPAVTTRAVAARADTNPGVIHYHFGGLPGLHCAVARQTCELVISPLVTMFLDAPDTRTALRTMRDALPQTASDDHTMRLAVELISGATRDSALGSALAAKLKEVRAEIADHVRIRHPEWTRRRAAGMATLIIAFMDGLVLHHSVDPNIETAEAFSLLESLLDVQ